MSYRMINIVFLAIWIISSIGLILYEIQAAMASSDPSAMAVFGFLPLIFPIFFMMTAMYIGPVYLIALIVNYLRGR